MKLFNALILKSYLTLLISFEMVDFTIFGKLKLVQL